MMISEREITEEDLEVLREKLRKIEEENKKLGIDEDIIRKIPPPSINK